jgi:lysophospholipase L1-like esterase
MRTIALISCFALFTGTPLLHADPLVKPDDTLAICGDSITAEHIYSAYMEDYLLMCAPVTGQKVAQFGWGGEQAPGFLARLDTDVFPFKPTIATSTYGMNDGHYAALTDEVANTYRKAQTDIVEAMKKNGVRTIVLGSPKCVDSFTYHNDPAAAVVYNQTLGSLADIDKDIAAKEGLTYADVFGATVDAMKKAKAKYGDKYVFAGGDGVHPGPNGSLVMAYAFLKALGYTGDIATVTVDLDASQAQATPGQEVESCKDGVVSLKSTKYPFCFSGSLGDQQDGNTAGIIDFVPFNQDLNRYMLIVKGLKTAKAKVTWGGESKEYSAEDLAKGVNLAADIMNNPFREQFFRVHQAVVMQENQEQGLVQGFMHDAKNYKNTVPTASAAVDGWITSGMALHDALYQGAQALVIPVEHTIKIEPVGA